MGGGGRLEKGIPTRLTPAEGRRFAFPVGIAFLALSGIVLWRQHMLFVYLFATLGGVLLVAGVLIPGKLGPVYRAWMRFALLLSKITTPIFMGIVFFLVIAPIGWVMRLLGKNPVRREEVDGSFWVTREPDQRRSDLSRQF